MTDPNVTATPPAGGAGQPPAGNNDPTVTTPPATNAPAAAASEQEPEQTDNSNEPMSLDEAKKLRSEAANLRKRLKDLDAKAQAEADAKLGDLERANKQVATLTAQVTELQTALRNERAGRQVDRQAAKMGLDADLATQLMAAQPLEYDEDNNPVGIEKALKALTAKWPHLVKPVTAPPPGSTNAADGRTAGPAVDPQARAAELRQRYRIP